MDRLLTKIVDNVQITIRNIHIRYENKKTLGGLQYSMGLTLKELLINTTNPEWEPKFFDRMISENRSNTHFDLIN